MNNSLKTAQRNSNVELLRIIAMLMIVAYHYAIYGFYADDLLYSRSKYLTDFLSSYGEAGVDIFVLISGYYMCRQEFSLKRLLVFLSQVWFYCLLALGLYCLFPWHEEPLSRGELLRSVFPICENHYWFASYYVLLMLLSPFLTLFAERAGRTQLRAVILLLMAVYTVLPTFFRVFTFYSVPGRLILLYFMAAYLRLYRCGSDERPKPHLYRALFWGCCIPVLSWVCDLAGQRTGNASLISFNEAFSTGSSFFGYMFALELFQYFRLRESTYRPWINWAAGLTFGVYLFHENYFFRDMWQRIFHTAQYAGSDLLIIHALCSIAAVYVFASGLDLLRKKSLGALWERLVSKYSPALEKKLSSVIHTVCERSGASGR